MPEHPPTTAIVSDVVCPHCGRSVDARADLCPGCGRATLLETALASQPRRLFDRPWFLLVMILHVGVLGIPLYWRTRYSFRIRLLLVGVSIAYTLAAVAAIIWGCAQILRMLRAA